MRSRSLLFFLSIVASSLLYSQNRQTLYPLPEYSKLQSVYVATTGTGWSVGSCGTVMRTSDGLNWDYADIGYDGDFKYVACRPGTDCQQIVIVASDLVLSSQNGGIDWTAYTEGIDNFSVRGETFFLDDEVVIVHLDNGALLRSTDNGQSWSPVTVPNTSLYRIDFPSGQVGYMGGSTTDLYRTDDAGLTWTALPIENEIRHLTFWNADRGWYQGNDRHIYRTDDGGASFTQVSTDLLPSNLMQLVAVTADSLVGVQVTDRIYLGSQGGSSWENFDLSTENGIRVNQVFLQDNQLWLASSAQAIYRSDLQFADVTQLLPAPRNSFTAMDFADEQTGYLFAHQTPLLKTADGGQSWMELTDNGLLLSRPEAVIAVTADDLIVLSNSSGGLQRSTDGGNSFIALLEAAVVAVDRTPLGDLIAVNAEASYHSSDDGQNWTAQSVPWTTPPNDVALADANLAIAVGEQGTVARTIDGGENWSLLDWPNNGRLNTVYFLDAEQVFIGGSGWIYRSTDGGQTWSDYPGGPRNVFKFDFVDETTGYAVTFESGNNGGLWRTTDGGVSWDLAGFACMPYRTMAAATGSGKVWAAGDGSIIDGYTFSYNPTFVEGEEAYRQIEIFPNPSREQLSVNTTELRGSVRAQLIDRQGKTLLHHAFEAGGIEPLNINRLPAGLYWIRLVIDQKIIVQKFVKE